MSPIDPFSCMRRRPGSQVWAAVTFVLLTFVLEPAAATLHKAAILGPDTKELHLGPYLEYLEDPDGQWTIADVTGPEVSSRFVAADRDVPNFGFTTSAYWVRFTLTNPGPETTEWLLELAYPMIDFLELYRPAVDGTYAVRKAGDRLPFHDREIEHPNLIFSVTLGAHESVALHLRSQTEGVTQFPLIIWSPTAFAAKVGAEAHLFLLKYGPLIGLIPFLFLFALLLHDWTYLSLVSGLLCMAMFLMCFDGRAYQYLWPGMPWLANKSLPTLIGLVGMTLTLACRGLLDSRRDSPWMDRYLLVQQLVFTLIIPLGLVASYAMSIRLAAASAEVAAPASLILILVRWRNGYRPAGYLLFAGCSMLGGIALIILEGLGFVPSNAFTHAAGRAGIAIAPVLLAIALADRFNTLAREKERAEILAKASARLSRYFPRKVAQRILSDSDSVDLATQRKCVTMVFSDLTGFTELSDRLAPETVSNTLNEYLGEMVRLAEEHGGTVNKFMGDGMLVLFGAADDPSEQEQANRAVAMAVAMHKRLKQLGTKWSDHGLDHDIQARIGIHQDYVTVGNFGSAELMDYTVIGTGVNLASRLEGCCAPGRIAVSFPVHSLTRSEFRYAPVAEHILKGFPHPVKVFELDSDPSDQGITASGGQARERVTTLDTTKRRKRGAPGAGFG